MSFRVVLASLTFVLALAPPALRAGDLQTLTDKKITATDKAIAKAQKRFDKLDARLDQRVTQLADATAAEVAAEAAVVAAQVALTAAEDDLAAAQALPAATAEQELARNAALSDASATLKQTAKDLKQALKAAKKATKKAARATKALDKIQARWDDGEDHLLDLGDDLNLLQGTFDFSSTHAVPLGLRIVDGEGQPLAGVQITLTDALVPPKTGKKGKKKGKKVLEDVTSPFTYWQGFTGPDGRIDTSATIALAAREIDVIVHAPGYTGEYTHDSLREEWGPLAPAVRITRQTRDLDDLDVVLEGDD